METQETVCSIPRHFWTARNFVKGFRNLRVPITTASESQIPGWQPHEVWEPYWKSIREYCDAHPASQELISAVMAKAAYPKLGTQAHRDLFQRWVDRHVPGYRIIWETDLMKELNEALAPYGETVAGFEYGKDGRGALPDRYYHLLAERKCLVVGNHHDILGHFLLFSDPEIRRVTEKIIRVSADGHSLHDTMVRYQREHLANNPAQREAFQRNVLNSMRPVMALLTFSWNLCQEKLYFSQGATAVTRSRFALLGAFNTVYNTTLSSKLPIEMADTTVAGLGIVADQGNRNIVMLPRDMRRWLLRAESLHESTALKTLRTSLSSRIDAYSRAVESVGWGADPSQEEATAHAARFKQIVLESLFAQWGKFRLPMGARWKKFGRAIQSDPFFAGLLNQDAMLRLGEAQIDVAEAALQYQATYFTERGRLEVARPKLVHA